MKEHADQFGLAAMCRVLAVHRSGYYAWLGSPASARARDDQRLLGLIKHGWLESRSVYGHRRITTDLRELGESCSRHRVARLMKNEGLRAMVGYGRRPRPLSRPVGAVAGNVLAREFTANEPDRAWVTQRPRPTVEAGRMSTGFLASVLAGQVQPSPMVEPKSRPPPRRSRHRPTACPVRDRLYASLTIYLPEGI